jgi:type IV secretion system protein VirB2
MIRTTMRVRRTIATVAAITYVNLALAPTAHASGSSMPWEQPLQQILQSIEGPVAKIVAVIIIIATGLALAFGDTSGGFRRLIQIGTAKPRRALERAVLIEHDAFGDERDPGQIVRQTLGIAAIFGEVQHGVRSPQTDR